MSGTPELIREGPLVEEAYDRMIEVMALITGTQSPSMEVEYSALLCAAAMIMAVQRGMTTSPENCSRVMELMANKVIPAIEAEVF